MLRLLVIVVLVMGVTGLAVAQSSPNVSVTAATSQVQSGNNVKFNFALSSNPGYKVYFKFKWKDNEYIASATYSQGYAYSFPCNSLNKGAHTVTILASGSQTNESTSNAADNAGVTYLGNPAYNIGSPNSATSTCNAL